MSLLKFILYSLIAYFVIRMVVRIFLTTKRTPHYQNSAPNTNKSYSDPSLEKPKFTIEAESVDYEVIESENKNEKK